MISSVAILSGALQYLAFPDRWMKKQYSDHKGKCCVVGALHLAAYDGNMLSFSSYDTEVAKKHAYRCLEDIIDPDAQYDVDVEAWNDAPERTLAEVLQTLSRAIQLAEQRGLT